MSAKLLDPKVHYVYRRFLTEKQMLGLLKKFKQKKYGMKIYAVDVEEVELTKPKTIEYRQNIEAFGRSRGDLIDTIELRPGNYFHLRVEYILG